MATLYIREYARLAQDQAGSTILVGAEPATTDHTLTIGATSLASTTFAATTQFLRLHTDTICMVVFGAAPTALTTSARMAANQTEFFGVRPGDKLAVIAGS